MNEIFYHLRDPQGRPHVTVCLLMNQSRVLSRGVAICSQQDNFSYKIGRIISKGRAIKAATSWITRPIRFFKDGYASDVYDILVKVCGIYLSDKAECNPVLTQFEKRLITSAGRLPNTDDVYFMAHRENEEFCREAMAV